MLLGGALDPLMETLILTLLVVAPCVGLTAAGALLWRRWRSAATAMIALGFAATFLSVASGLIATYTTHALLSDLTTAPPVQPDTFFIVAHFHRFLLLGVLGLWTA